MLYGCMVIDPVVATSSPFSSLFQDTRKRSGEVCLSGWRLPRRAGLLILRGLGDVQQEVGASMLIRCYHWSQVLIVLSNDVIFVVWSRCACLCWSNTINNKFCSYVAFVRYSNLIRQKKHDVACGLWGSRKVPSSFCSRTGGCRDNVSSQL